MQSKVRWSPLLISAAIVCGGRWGVAAEPSAEQILNATGVKGGLIIHLGCGDGRLTVALHDSNRFLVQGLETDPQRLAEARKNILAEGAYGPVSAIAWDGRRLPYADNLVNLLLAEDLGPLPMEEVMRVLAPRGVAYVRREGQWVKTVKPWPRDLDEWTHYLHGPDNNAVSHDRVVGPPRCLQWVSDPVYGRHHNYLASVSAMVGANGRVFSIEDRGPALSMELPADWRLLARDAFSGVTLWELPIRQWQTTKTGFRSGPVELPRRLVAVGDRVYVAFYGEPLLCLDAATGRALKTFQGTEGVEEILFCDGTLYLAAGSDSGKGGRRILTQAAESGKTIWTSADGPARGILPGTLAVGPQRLFFHDGQAVVALDRSNGRVAWRRPLPSITKRPPWSAPTIVSYQGVVLCGDRAVDYAPLWKQNQELLSGMQHGGPGLLTALSAEDGAVLWQNEAAECFHNAVDVFAIDGLIWASQGPAWFFFERTRPILADKMGENFYIGSVTGRDPRTGEVKKTIDAAEAFTLSHHHRCYRDKATDRYIIMGRTGSEFIDLAGGPSLRHNWTRGMCQYGVMPANGLLYTPPHPCACYNASKLNGFFAFSSRKEAAWTDENIVRLQSGRNSEGDSPTFAERKLGQPPADARADDWPTFRHDNERSGGGDVQVADRLAVSWRRDLRGKLSAPTSADGKVFVSAVDRHTVYALDLESGKELWSYMAGGRVDSPPTYWKGRVYFGSADGTIHCLSATDGALVWRFLAVPQQASIVVRDQLESPWPVAGSVLVRDAAVYALAGRSSNLDGGMYFIKLDALSGRPLLTRQIYSRDPQTGRQAEQLIDDLYMPGLLYDVPSSRGESIFVREARLSLEGVMSLDPQEHLYSTGGFLDDTWWHRYYMIYGTRFRNGPGGGPGRSGGAPAGRLLVCDAKHVFGYGGITETRYHLFCTAKTAEDPATTQTPPSGKEARRGKATSSATIWSDTKCPVMVQAMILAGRTPANGKGSGRLVLAGRPAETDLAVPRGARGGLLAVIDASTGKGLSQTPLDVPPVFDGICAARGRVVLSLTGGTVVSCK